MQGHKSRISDPSCAVCWFVDKWTNANDTFSSCLPACIISCFWRCWCHKPKKVTADWRPPCAELFNYTNACWASCQGLSFCGGFIIIQRWRKMLCCHNGRQLKVNQCTRKKWSSHVIRAMLVSSRLVVDASGAMWQFTSNISVSPIMHLWGMGQVLVEIWMPDMESTAARAPITQQSHLSQTHAHTDTAVFCVINKKWKHEALAGRPLKSSASKSSASGFFTDSLLAFFPLVYGFVSLEGDVLLMLTTCCSVPAGRWRKFNIQNLSSGVHLWSAPIWRVWKWQHFWHHFKLSS